MTKRFQNLSPARIFRNVPTKKNVNSHEFMKETRDRIIAYKTPGRFETVGFAFEARR